MEQTSLVLFFLFFSISLSVAGFHEKASSDTGSKISGSIRGVESQTRPGSIHDASEPCSDSHPPPFTAKPRGCLSRHCITS